jgi:predicted nucleic acid-binding protein
MPFVLDASCALALAFDEPSLVQIPDLRHRIVSQGVYVPPLWKWEMANAMISAARRSPEDMDTVMAQLYVFERLPIAIDDGSLEGAWGATSVLAVKHKLTAYDAAYLEISLRRSLPVATFDTALARAARAEGVEVIAG